MNGNKGVVIPITEPGVLYMGVNAGGHVKKSIRAAKKSIRIMSPFLTYQDSKGKKFIKSLMDKVSDGIEVSIITTEGFAQSRNKSHQWKKESQILREAVRQRRESIPGAKEKRFTGIRYTVISSILLIISVAYGAYFINVDFLFGLLGLLGTIAIFKKYQGMQTFSYSYEFTFPILINIEKNWYPHAKVYLIDEKIAYIGSLNYTLSGFETNYETCFEIKDKKAITKLYEEWDSIVARGCFKEVDCIGKRLYPEPKNEGV
ncbi:hypothetical protein JYT58_01100 [bacterium AH-315-G11]|nr:hypothetical protein [bacterium AH-315-G11]